MKIKTLACLCALAAIPAFGTEAVTSGNTFGVLKVTCDTQKAIIATPWVECLTAGNVKITDLVMTSGLSDGDAIIVYVNGAFKGWYLSSGTWTPYSTATEIAGVSVSGDASAEAIARGKAFWFVKNSFTAGDTYNLYLYGQEDTEATASSTVLPNAYSLLASPKIGGVNLATASLWTSMSINADDKIVVPNGAATPTTYTYKDGSWGTTTTETLGNGRVVTKRTAGGTIPEGRGFWYISKGGSGTINW